MGRMDEALRRNAAAGGVAVQPLTIPNQRVFSAPWEVVAPADRPRSAEPGPVALPRATETPVSLLEEPRRSAFTGFSQAWQQRVVTGPHAEGHLVEEFRALAALLHRLRANGTPKSLLVTSADSGEGKTMTALNLALTWSESYKHRVLLIDADLRQPSLGDVSQLADHPGLSEGLRATTDKKLGLVQVTDMLTLLPAGRPDPNPMSGLTSVRMRRILAEASEQFDWVIVDAPPLGPVADAGLLAGMVDAALLVVRAGRTTHAAATKAIEALGRDRILGVVLNGGTGESSSSYGYYGSTQPAADRLPTDR